MYILEEEKKITYDFLDRGDVEPVMDEFGLHIWSGRYYGTGCGSQIILNDSDLTTILIGYWYLVKKKKRFGGQFYRHYKHAVRIDWKKLDEEDKLRILDQPIPEWARLPGKLKRDYLRPHFHSRVERDNAGNIIAYKYLVWDETEQVFKSFAYHYRDVIWIDNSLTADSVPTEENSHGIYCAKTPNNPVLRSYARHRGVKLVRLLLSGVVVEYDHGYRAEHADILEVCDENW
jgi:hypothetical protein